MQVISEKTLVPISIVSVLTGGIVWFSAMWFKTEATAAEMVNVKTDLSKLQVDVIDRLARIETKLDTLKEK